MDTSVLVKLYVTEEDGSEELLEQLEKTQVDEIILCEITRTEFAAALYKKVRMKELEEEQAKQLLALFRHDKESYRWVLLDQQLNTEAEKLLHRYGVRGLRTLDALQFAAALRVRDEAQRFLTDDTLLRTFFEDEGLVTTL